MIIHQQLGWEGGGGVRGGAGEVDAVEYGPRRSPSSARAARGRTHERGAGRHIALGLARALHWLHATAGIVHQSLRPSKGAPAPPCLGQRPCFGPMAPLQSCRR